MSGESRGLDERGYGKFQGKEEVTHGVEQVAQTLCCPVTRSTDYCTCRRWVHDVKSPCCSVLEPGKESWQEVLCCQSKSLLT